MKTRDIPTDDPLKMIWTVREKIYDETKDMTGEEWSQYLHCAEERVLSKLAHIKAEEQKDITAGIVVKKIWE